MSAIDTVLAGLPLSLSLDWSGNYTAEVSAGKREKIATLYRISPTSQIQVVTYHYNDPEKPLHHVRREYLGEHCRGRSQGHGELPPELISSAYTAS